jgi:hypothetical protein
MTTNIVLSDEEIGYLVGAVETAMDNEADPVFYAAYNHLLEKLNAASSENNA